MDILNSINLTLYIYIYLVTGVVVSGVHCSRL